MVEKTFSLRYVSSPFFTSTYRFHVLYKLMNLAKVKSARLLHTCICNFFKSLQHAAFVNGDLIPQD